jgi:hypothetical protein
MPHTFKSNLIQECYLRAAEARKIANEATDPFTRADFVALERRWLYLGPQLRVRRAVTSGLRSDLSRTECVSCFTLGPADTLYRREITEQSVMDGGRSPTIALLGVFLPQLGPVGCGPRGLFPFCAAAIPSQQRGSYLHRCARVTAEAERKRWGKRKRIT